MAKIPLQLAGAHRHQSPRVVGIDLGTTNSLVGYMEAGEPRIIEDEAGRALLPSVVCYHPDGRTLVGEAARECLSHCPERTVYSVKRLMGRGLADVEGERALLPYALSDQHREVVRIRIDDRLYTPPEVSAQILRTLKERGERHLGVEVTQAVITVPAYFNDSQRQATRDAGRIAGLDVLRIVNEPTAACLAYGLDRRREGTMAVYDLGGGTFDISILKLRDGIFEVQSTSGDTHLGGDDMDRALADRLLAEIAAGEKQTAVVRERVRLAAEQAKRELSTMESTSIRLELDGRTWERDLTRGELEALIDPIVARTLAPCRQALEDAEVSAPDLDAVVLVGGSTRVPLVRRRVQQLFGQAPRCELDPDLVVALGAAVQAGILSGDVEGLLLLDVNPLSLGIETYGGTVEKLIPRNSTLPTSARQVFTTGVEGQAAVGIHVVQGERELADDNRSLARFEIHIPPMPAGWPRLEVNFLVDENGILTVSAFEHRSQAEGRIEVRPSYGLTDDEVERMVIESFEHAERDLRLRLLVEARVEADLVLRATEKQLPLAEQFVEEGSLSRAGLVQIRVDMEALEAAGHGEDHHAIRARLEQLDLATRRLAELVMDRAVGEALRGKTLEDAAYGPTAAVAPGPAAEEEER